MTESERALLILTAMHTRDALDGAGYTASAKTLAEAIKSAQPPAEPKPSASALPQRLRANSYNAPTWNDCDVMREAAHALENKDTEIAAVIRDNDAKMVEIERLRELIEIQKKTIGAIGAENEAPRNPDIEAAALRLENIVVPFYESHPSYGVVSHIGKLTDIGRITVARAILTREPG